MNDECSELVSEIYVHQRSTTKETCGFLADGRAISRYVLTNGELSLAILDYGLVVESLGTKHQHSSVISFTSGDKPIELEKASAASQMSSLVSPSFRLTDSAVADRGQVTTAVMDNVCLSNAPHAQSWEGNIAIDARGPCVEFELTWTPEPPQALSAVYCRVRVILGTDELLVEYQGICDRAQPVNFGPKFCLGRIGSFDLSTGVLNVYGRLLSRRSELEMHEENEALGPYQFIYDDFQGPLAFECINTSKTVANESIELRCSDKKIMIVSDSSMIIVVSKNETCAQVNSWSLGLSLGQWEVEGDRFLESFMEPGQLWHWSFRVKL